MRSRNPIYIAVILAIAFAATGFAIENPVANNPLGLGTVPQTAYKSGLIPSIKPIDTRGNLVITGNVTGGMQFRGIVPYSSVTDFSIDRRYLANTSGGIDSFLKRTEGSQSTTQAKGGLTPFYSPSMTVTKTIPGSGGMITSQSVSGYTAPQYSGVSMQSEQTPRFESGQAGLYQRRFAPQLLQRPLSTNPMDIEKSVVTDVSKYPLGGEQAAEERLLENFWKQMGVQITRKTESQAEEAKQISGIEPNIGSYLEGLQARQRDTLGKGLREQPEQVEISGLEGIRQRDVYEKMKIQLGKPVIVEGMPEKGEEQVTGQFPGLMGQDSASTGQASSSLRYEGQAEPNAALSTKSDAGAAEMILDTYKSFAAYNNDRFNRSIRAAEHYMKQGRFYRAADAYTVATVYKPEDPLGYAGKSIALFATGEYMSSSLFLARAMEIFPEYPKIKVDLIEMIGDKDTVENRIVEAREWLEKSGSGELAFLLSYIYYQLDRLEFARQTIEFAEKKLPDSQVVAAMKKAVNERLGKH
ncbi:MAG: hypothetical protein JW749_07465 [Sedimentisphaerales bacterium]|nr:hypothetical protein [Sedimentisphaerales bacterium]